MRGSIAAASFGGRWFEGLARVPVTIVKVVFITMITESLWLLL